MSYIVLKSIHVVCVVLTVALMLTRLSMALAGHDYRRFGALRWIPHAVDTLLLASAAGLVIVSGQYPFAEPWLTAKLLALPLYVIAGAIALDPSRSSRVRAFGGCAALCLLAYIVLVARTRNPWPAFAILGG